MAETVLLSWDIDVFDDDADVHIPAASTAEEKALIYAKAVQKRCFKEGTNWTFNVTIDERKYLVDLEDDHVEAL